MLPKFGTKAGKRVQLAEARQRERKLTGNNREIRVFDPSGSTPGTMSPWMPLWALFNDELLQRCEQGREPKLRAPYNRTRRDYKSSIENGSTVTRHHATKKKSPAQLQREIDEVLANPSGSAAGIKRDQQLAEAIDSGSRERAAALYGIWTSQYSNEDLDRISGLAGRLTDIDRQEGRAAPPVGSSRLRLDQAKQVVRDANGYGAFQQGLSAQRRARR